MNSGADPRDLLKEMLSSDAVIPTDLDQLTLWKIILNMISEPPRRKKLGHINTLTDVVDLIKKSKKIIVLTGKNLVKLKYAKLNCCIFTIFSLF